MPFWHSHVYIVLSPALHLRKLNAFLNSQEVIRRKNEASSNRISFCRDMGILIVEDEIKTADYLRQGLTENGFVVDVATNGLDGRHLVIEHD
ncbi:MAG: hypothetical protein HY661_10390 [Betaproteobacteria bacterium]|nr:hypothetical protein [Betaproteobacteria bacterium]